MYKPYRLSEATLIQLKVQQKRLAQIELLTHRVPSLDFSTSYPRNLDF